MEQEKALGRQACYALNTYIGDNVPPLSRKTLVPWENSSKLLPRIIRLLLVFVILLEFQVGQVEIAVGLLFVNLCIFFYLRHVVYLVYLAHDEIVIASRS